MKRKRCAAAGIILAMLLITLCGCAANKTLEEQMVSHMEAKYGDVFTYVRPWGSSLGQKSICRVLQSDRYPGQDVLVSCSREDGELVFLDSYPALQMDGKYKYIRKEWEDPVPEEERKTEQEERSLFWETD